MELLLIIIYLFKDPVIQKHFKSSSINLSLEIMKFKILNVVNDEKYGEKYGI